MIDTGADISLFKINENDNIQHILSDAKCRITGITNTETSSLGTITAKLYFDNNCVNQEFHVVDDNFPISTNGILGRDFLMQTLCKIDYETFTISLYTNENETTIPMLTKLPKYENIIIPARMQVVKPINIDLSEDSVILNEEIQNGVYIANTIVPAKGIVHVKSLNTLETDVIIRDFKPRIRALTNYNIIEPNIKMKKETKRERYERLLKELKLENLDKQAQKSLLDIFKEYSDVFHLHGDKLTINNFYKQKIKVEDKTPVYIKNYRLPESQMEEINKQVDKLMEEEIIEPSVSPYNSPLLIVPKKADEKDKKWRLVVDYRQLNKKIVDDKFPITRLDDILDNLGRAKYFSTLDLTSSFHQIELSHDSRPLTAFSTNKGHYQFNRLPFGLKISTNSFQRMLSIALAGLDSEAFLYVDDIIIFGCSLKHHNQNLVKTFDRLRKYNLKVNPLKCNFLKTEVTYLGHLITNEGIKTDPKKYDVVKNYPEPTSADEAKRFIAFCNYYRRFIPKFAEIAKPLNNLSKKDVEFTWNEECRKAFSELKQKLINPPILKYPNFNETFILTTDASNYALGAVLSQGEIGEDLPISYASRTLNKYELNKPIIEKELLSIHWAINFFRPYLYGRKFVVVTDHRPLVSLFSHKNPSSKLTRIRLDLSDYDFEIRYKQGKINTNADALSRIKIDSDILKAMIPTENVNVVTRAMNKKMEQNNEDLGQTYTPQMKTDHLYTWNCISLSEIKNVRKLKFINGQNNNKDINKKGKTRYNKSLQSTKIKIHKKNVDIEFSENPYRNLGLILEKLTSAMENNNIDSLAISDNDELFKYCNINEFKKIYNKLQQNKENNKQNKENNKENKQTILKILIYRPPTEIKDEIKQQNLIKEYHDAPHSGGHTGVKRTINKLKQKYVWKNMSKMVKKHIDKCMKCAQNKQLRKTKEKLVITNTPTTTFEIVSMDTVGPLRIDNDYRYILTIQCELSKYIEAFPMENKEAKTIAKILIDKIILRYGRFNIIKTDLGTEFMNETFRCICNFFEINHVKSTPFHHETLGSIERNHRVLNEYLLSFTSNFNWTEWIPYFTFCYNITPHTDTGLSPYELVYGKLASLPNDTELGKNHAISRNVEEYIKELKYKLEYACNKAKNLLDLAKVKRKVYYDTYTNPLKVNVGDLVWLKVGNKKKLDSPFKGPYEVIEINGVNSKIRIGDNIKEVHNNRLKKN